MQSLNYFRLPNYLLRYNLSASELCVTAYLYSLQQASQNSCDVCCRQEIIAQACHISIRTVARIIDKLIAKDIIIQKERKIRTDLSYGTYIYTLQPITNKRRYFRVPRKALPLLTPNEYRMYLWFCCLADEKNRFFQSYSELNDMLVGIERVGKRSDVINLVAKLASKKLILKNTKLNKCGDYTDNHYTVFVFGRLSIRKRRPKFKNRTVATLMYALAHQLAPVFFIDKGGG